MICTLFRETQKIAGTFYSGGAGRKETRTANLALGTDSVTLYAQMIDDIASVLGEASYNSGYKDIGNWLVRKKRINVEWNEVVSP